MRTAMARFGMGITVMREVTIRRVARHRSGQRVLISSDATLRRGTIECSHLGNNTLGNSIPSSSTVYHPNVASAYSASNYSSSIRPSYNLSPSQSSANIYAAGYPPSLAILPPNDLQSSSWNPYAAMPTAGNLANGTHPMNYDPNVYYAPYYGDMYGQPYYPAQPAAEQNLSPNGFAPSTATTTNAAAEKTYQPVSR